jgi:hypothetical protein
VAVIISITHGGDGFRRSQGQIAAEAARASQRIRRDL